MPAKLVAKIVKGDYVDMAELLRDNIEVDRWKATDSSAAGLSTSQAHRQDVPDFLSWLQCFGVYVGIVATHKPEKLRQLTAYQTLMIREARRCVLQQITEQKLDCSVTVKESESEDDKLNALAARMVTL